MAKKVDCWHTRGLTMDGICIACWRERALAAEAAPAAPFKLQLRADLGWDDEDCEPVADDTLEIVAGLLGHLSRAFEGAFRYSMPAPQITPTSEGGVDLLWKAGGFDLFVAVHADGTAPFRVNGKISGTLNLGETLEEQVFTKKLPLKGKPGHFISTSSGKKITLAEYNKDNE